MNTPTLTIQQWRSQLQILADNLYPGDPEDLKFRVEGIDLVVENDSVTGRLILAKDESGVWVPTTTIGSGLALVGAVDKVRAGISKYERVCNRLDSALSHVRGVTVAL